MTKPKDEYIFIIDGRVAYTTTSLKTAVDLLRMFSDPRIDTMVAKVVTNGKECV